MTRTYQQFRPQKESLQLKRKSSNFIVFFGLDGARPFAGKPAVSLASSQTSRMAPIIP